MVFKGEVRVEEEEKVVKLTKKMSLLNSFWIKAGYENISITGVKFSYKSRCPYAATGLIELNVRDLRLECEDEQTVANVEFDVKESTELTWSYPVWFHYSDFNGAASCAMALSMSVYDSNMVEKYSLGSYVLKITYKMQNQITGFRQTQSKAILTNRVVKPQEIVCKRDANQRKNIDKIIDKLKKSSINYTTNKVEEHKNELLERATSHIISVRK
jgi:hypothetical protein